MTNPEDIGRTESFASGFEHSDDRFDPRLDDFPTKNRKYIHFDYALTDHQREELRLGEIDVSSHSFWPLLFFSIKSRHKLFGENGEKIGFRTKDREIRFASHMDAAIIERYGKQLSIDYENCLDENNISQCVLAYRPGVGDNVTQAKEFFDLIKNYSPCTAIAFDISKFFNKIQHRDLKDNLKSVLKTTSLVDDDYHIFKTIAKYAWIDKTALVKRLGGKGALPFGRLCYPDTFRRLVKQKSPKIIFKNNNNYGIPQGSPISGLYANISMLEFDIQCARYFSSIGGFYRRYSDDIAILLPSERSYAEAESFIISHLEGLSQELNLSKTDVSNFSDDAGIISCHKAFQYLGFLYDGEQVLIRPSSIQNYYKKMRKGIRAKILAAKRKGISQDEIYMRDLYKKYTHYGRRRNFPRYAFRASKVMDSPAIKGQISGHMDKFRRYTNEAIEKYYSS